MTPCSSPSSAALGTGPADRRALAGPAGRPRVGRAQPRELLTDIAHVSAELCRLGAEQGRRDLSAASELDRSGHLHLRSLQVGRRRLPDHDHLPPARAVLHPRRTESRILVAPSTYRGFDYAAMVRELADGLPHLEHVICVGETATVGVISSRELVLDGQPIRSAGRCRERRPRGPRLHIGHDR